MLVVEAERPTSEIERLRPASGRGGLLLVSTLVTTCVTAVFALLNADLRHWFIVPVTACGCVLGIDIIRWLRNEIRLFDPIGFVGLFGYHFFFLAPLLHVQWQVWPLYVPNLDDYRPWLGKMAVLNLAGILAYRAIAGSIAGSRPRSRRRVFGVMPARMRAYFGAMAVVGFVVAGVTFVRAGGFAGLSAQVTQAADPLRGSGWILTIGESAPVMLTAYWCFRRRKAAVSTLELWAVLGGFFVLQFLVAGLRGSRGNVVYGGLVAAGVAHHWLRPLSRRQLGVAGLVLLAFMYLYGFYKVVGADAINVILDKDRRELVSEESGRALPNLLLQDLGRADIQATLLHNRLEGTAGVPLAGGRTYVSDLLSLIPSRLRPSPPYGKVEYGTALLYDQSPRSRDEASASNIYGLSGEAILNFGVLAVPVAFALYGCVIGLVTRATRSLTRADDRLVLSGGVAVVSVLLLTSDLDNAMYSVVQYCLLLAVGLFVARGRVPERATAPSRGPDGEGPRT